MDKISEESLATIETYASSGELLYYGLNITEEKDYKKLIRTLQQICRKSLEYDEWQKRTKTNAVDQNPDDSKDDSMDCPCCRIDYKFAPPETHHHPTTLFSVVDKKLMELLHRETLLDTPPLKIAYDIMLDHLSDKVENVVLCKHCHEKYHKGDIRIAEIIDAIIEHKRKMKYGDRHLKVYRPYNKTQIDRLVEFEKKEINNDMDSLMNVLDKLTEKWN